MAHSYNFKQFSFRNVQKNVPMCNRPDIKTVISVVFVISLIVYSMRKLTCITVCFVISSEAVHA